MSAAAGSSVAAAPKEPQCQILETKGDLFAIDDNYCHCVSQDFEMGKGIAVLFRDKFGQIDALKAQKPAVGGCAYITRMPPGASVRGLTVTRYVFYLVTKEKYWQKPTLKTLAASLTRMKDLCINLKITTLAMPRIGCGLDRLNWDNVKHVVTSVFHDVPICITVRTP